MPRRRNSGEAPSRHTRLPFPARLWFAADEGGSDHEFGGPEKLRLVDVEIRLPERERSLVDVARSGINFADTHATRNDYLAEQSLPLIPGTEVSGRTADGRRVAALLGSGGYAEKVAVPEALLIPLPDEVDDDQAAALLLQGLTAMALVQRCARIEPGETLVVEAAAGGTGGMAVQLGKRAGAKVIGLASSEEKRALVERLGADATVDSRAENLGEAIREANGGERVDAVLHMSGGKAFDEELGDPRPARPHGRLRHRLARTARGLHGGAAARLQDRGRLLAAAPAGPPRAGRADDRRAARHRRQG